jgi:glucose-1-phosphate adenylyltransferase
MGIYVFEPDYLMKVLENDAHHAGSRHDFGKDIIPRAVAEGDAYAFPFRDLVHQRQAYWRDVGNIDSFWAANLELIGEAPELDLYDHAWPIWTYQEQLPPAKFAYDPEGRPGHALDTLVSGGCIITGATVRGSVLFSDVVVEPGADVEASVVLPKAVIGRDCRIRRAVIETGCVLPPGTVIGEDPEADADRFELSSGGVVLVTPEMLGQVLPYVR